MTELANLPFTWPSAGRGSCRKWAKRMTELAPKYLAAEHQGLHILFMNMANPIVIYSRMPIKTLDDFKGKKIRYASITNKFLLEALGAVPMLVPPQESQDALAKGVVDGAGFPHEAGFAYDLVSVVALCDRAAARFGHLRDGDEPGQSTIRCRRICAPSSTRSSASPAR